MGEHTEFYSRKDVQEAIVAACKQKEVGVSFQGAGYGKRPCIIQYPKDVETFANEGVTSFHASEEIWKAPMLLRPAMDKAVMDKLRAGWDLILDIDCKEFEYSKIATYHIVRFLKKMGIKAVTCKFSGNKGFHIAVPFESFPTTFNNKNIKDLFPEAPKKISMLVLERIKKYVEKDIKELEQGDLATIAKKVGLSLEDLKKEEITEFGDKRVILDAEPLIGIDTIFLAARHLYRLEYSYNEKSGLISVPVDTEKILAFKKSMAIPKEVKINHSFLDRTQATLGEAQLLLRESYDSNIDEIERKFIKAFIPEELAADFQALGYAEFNDVVPEMYFPPCIKKILEGLADGRKRSMFILTNFLFSVGWHEEDIEALLIEWDAKNPKKLGEGNIKSHVKYHGARPKTVLPPNCKSHYYKELGICHPDKLCPRIKNPVVYAIKNFRVAQAKKST